MTTAQLPNLGIFYYGGSGGFFALHLVLLSGIYKCVFNGEEQDFETIFDRQWNIKHQQHWKQSETWPNNSLTHQSEFKNKVFFFCNPSPLDFDNFDGIKLVVYTDFKTQFTLAKAKNAYIYNKGFKEKLNEDFKKFYLAVKDPQWPTCSTVEEFYFLPEHVQHECINDHSGLMLDYSKYEMSLEKDMGLYLSNGMLVDKNLLTTIHIDDADILTTLQQLIKTEGKNLYKDLNLVYNKQCEDFTNHYVSLHTVDQQKLLKNSNMLKTTYKNYNPDGIDSDEARSLLEQIYVQRQQGKDYQIQLDQLIRCVLGCT